MSYSLKLGSSKNIQDASLTSEVTENVYAKEIYDMNRINISNSMTKNENTDEKSSKKKKGKKKNFMKIFKKKKKKSKNSKDNTSVINDDFNYLFSNINNVDSKKYFHSFNELNNYNESLNEIADSQIESNNQNNSRSIKDSKIKGTDKKEEYVDKESITSNHKKKKQTSKKKKNSQNNDKNNENIYKENINNEYNIDKDYNFEPEEDLKKELEKIKIDIDKIKKKGNLKRIYDDLKYILLFQNEIIDTLIDDIRKNKLKTKYDLFDDCTIKGDVNKMILNQITLDLLKFKYINTKLKELIICVYDTKKFNSLIRKIIYNKLDEMKKIVAKDGELTIARSMLIFLYKRLKYCLEEEVQSYYNNVRNINDDIHNIKKNILNIICDSINNVCSLPDPRYIYNTNKEECMEEKKLKEKKLICPIFANDLNNFFYLYDNVYSEENTKEISTENFKNFCFKNSLKGNCENSNSYSLNKNESIKYNIPLRDIYKSYLTNVRSYENAHNSASYNYADNLNSLNNPYINETVHNMNDITYYHNSINCSPPLNNYRINKKINQPYYYVCNLKKKNEDQINTKKHNCIVTSPCKVYINPPIIKNINDGKISSNNNILMCNEGYPLLNNDISKKKCSTNYMKYASNYNNERYKKYIKYNRILSNDNNNINMLKKIDYSNNDLNNIWNNCSSSVYNERHEDMCDEYINSIKKEEQINKNNKKSEEMCEKRETLNGNMYTGFEIISSKEEIKKLENFLNDKWGSFKLFEKWIKDCSKWQWIDLKLQREQVSSNIELEKLKEEKKKYLEKCINNKIKELWCGRMKGLMNLKLCDMEKKIVNNFSSNIISQNVKDIILDYERSAMCFEDLFANSINKEVYNQKLNFLKKYNKYKDKNRNDKGDEGYDKKKILLGSNSENMKYTHKKKGYVKSLIYSFNKISQKNSNKNNTYLKKNSELCNNEQNNSIKTYISPTDNKNIEKNENNNILKINLNSREMEINKQIGKDKNTYVHNNIKDYDIIKNIKNYSLKDNILLNKIEYIKKNSKDYVKNKYSDVQLDSFSSMDRTKSNLMNDGKVDSFEYSKSIEKNNYNNKKKHRKSNMSTFRKFFNLKKKKKKEKKKKENLLSESYLPDNKWNSSNGSKDYNLNKKKDIINFIREKDKNNSSFIAHDELHSLDKEKKNKIIEKEKQKIKPREDLVEEEKYETHNKSSIQNNRYLNDVSKLHKLAKEKAGNKSLYSSIDNDLNRVHYDLKNVHSFEGSHENYSLNKSLNKYKINEKMNKSVDYLKKEEKEEKNDSVEFDVSNIKEKLNKDNLSYYDNRDKEINKVIKKDISLTNSEISYSSVNKEDNKYEKFSSIGSIKKRNKKNKINKFFKNLGKLSFKSSKKAKKKGNDSSDVILDSFSTISNAKSEKKLPTEKENLEKKNNNDDFNQNTSKSFLTYSDLSNKNSIGKRKMSNRVDKLYSYINKLKEKKKDATQININYSDESLNNYNASLSLDKKGEYKKEEEDYKKDTKYDEEYEYMKSDDKKKFSKYSDYDNDNIMKKYEKKSKNIKKEKEQNKYDNYYSSSSKNVDVYDNKNSGKKKWSAKEDFMLHNDNGDNDKIIFSSDDLIEKNVNYSKLSPRFGYSLSNQDFSKKNENPFENNLNFDECSESKSKKKKKKNEKVTENKYNIKFDDSGNIIDKKEKKKEKKFIIVASSPSNDLNKYKSTYEIKENIDIHKDVSLSDETTNYKIDNSSLYNNVYFEEKNSNLKDNSPFFLNSKNSSTFFKNQKREENSSNSHEIIRLSSFKSKSDINALYSDDQKVDVLSCENAPCDHNMETKKEDYSYYKYVQSILPFGILSQKEYSDADSQRSGKVNASEKYP